MIGFRWAAAQFVPAGSEGEGRGKRISAKQSRLCLAAAQFVPAGSEGKGRGKRISAKQSRLCLARAQQ